jgi:hypothetical protein
MMNLVVEMKCRCFDYSPILRQLKMTWINTSQQQQHLVTALFSQTINRKRDFANSYPPSDRSAYAERARKTFKSVIRLRAFRHPSPVPVAPTAFSFNRVSSRSSSHGSAVFRSVQPTTNHNTHFSEPRPKSLFFYHHYRHGC